MSTFIEHLESRRMLSVTKDTLMNDAALVNADAAALKADMKAFANMMAADTKTIMADLKGSAKTNEPLLNALRKDEAKLLEMVRKDANALTGPASALAKRSAEAGVALMHKSNPGALARVAADVAALNSFAAAPLAKLAADETSVNLSADLQALVTANPSNTSLAAHVSAQQADIQTQGTAFNTAAAKVQTDMQAMATDLQAAPPGPASGSGGTTTTIPHLEETWTGSSTATAGNHVGRVSTLSITFTSEAADGSFTGTVTVTNPGQSPQTSAVTGTVNAAGVFTATVGDSSSGTTTALSGTVTGKTISGTYNGGSEDSGTFTVTKS